MHGCIGVARGAGGMCTPRVHWRFYVGARGGIGPPNDKLLNTGQLDRVVLLLVDVGP